MRYNLQNGFRGDSRHGRKYSLGQAAVALPSNSPSTWVEAAIMAREECDAARCQPAQPSDGTKGLFCFIVKRQCLLLKYDRELKGAL